MKELEELVAKIREACNRNTRVLRDLFKTTLPDIKRRLEALEKREKLRTERDRARDPLGGIFG